MRFARFGFSRGWILCAAVAASISFGCNRIKSPNQADLTGDPAGDTAADKTDAQSDLASASDLRDRLDGALDFTLSKRHLNTKDHAAWQIVHGALVFGRDFQIDNDGKRVGALDYLLQGNPLNGWNMRKGDHGVEAILEEGSKTGQGHPDQWLGYLSQCGLGLDEPIVVRGGEFKVRDLVTQAQWNVRDGMEATWTLMALSKYLPLDAKWPAKDGSEWTIDRIVAMEAAQNLDESACGGSHRLYGLSVAVKRYEQEKGTVQGAWKEAKEKIDDAVAKSRQFQQPDGTLSTAFFARAATVSDVGERIYATGHTLEFLMIALDDEQLKQPWVEHAVLALVDLFEDTQDLAVECGRLYHAAHGLQLYRERRFGPRIAPSQGS